MNIADFQDLELPVSDREDGDGEWFVRVINNHDSYYILNDGSAKLGDLMELNVTNFYFDTKLEAHEAAFAYYVAAKGKAYPYFDDFMDEKNGAGSKNKTTNNVAHSQHMRFE